MKQTVTIVVMSIVILLLGYVSFYKYQESKDLQEKYSQLAQTLQSEREDWKKKYNTAIVAIHDKEIQVKVLDEKLKKEMGKKPTVIERVSIRTVVVDHKEGILTPVTSSTSYPESPTILSYKDFRLDATVNVPQKQFSYDLHQDLGINVYRTDELTFKGEVLEYANGKLYKAYPIEPGKMRVDLTLKKTKGWHTGFNLMLGAGGMMNTKAIKGSYALYVVGNAVSYGATHLDSDWRFVSLGASNRGLVLIPVSYRISNMIPLLSDMFVDSLTSVPYPFDGWSIGVGVSSTF